MNAKEGWDFLVEQARRSVATDEEMLTFCRAVEITSGAFGAEQERAAALRLSEAIRERDKAQLRFDEIISKYDQIGGLGE